MNRHISRDCRLCSKANPHNAAFCMYCGNRLQDNTADEIESTLPGKGLTAFGLSVAASLLISLVLVRVFGLPIFFLAGFLPLFWSRPKK